MPELPEIQTVVNGLNRKILNKKVLSLNETRKGTVQNFVDKNIPDLGVLSSVKRRGKYIIVETSNNYKLVIHLRMTGKLIYETFSEIKSSHERANFIFTDKTKLIFDDVRTFGRIQIFNIYDKINSLERLGAEPLSDDFDYRVLRNKLKNRKAPVKNVLLDQTVIAGLGNIYAAEILFRAKVHPAAPAKRIKTAELKRIVMETKNVLQEAIKHNGTTISDYRSVEDKTGEFQEFLKVYGKSECEYRHQIKRIKQAGRSTYYCPVCQK